ncbi:aspartate/glutamate racemase family protein, partial [Candidatus Woesearchaeota archaeon]|nr:aspartate/glutamate racemase family protein [Candidatus Woesearchaeota archaeon]
HFGRRPDHNNKRFGRNKIRAELLNNGRIRHLLQAIDSLKKRGAEAVILGCTDLQILVSERDSALPLIDTLEVLENAAVDFLVRGETAWQLEAFADV